MSDPITLTTATLVALAASKFVETAAAKVAEVATPAALKKAGQPIDQLWGRIKQHFAGNERAEKAIAEVETQQSEAALSKLEVYLDDELNEPGNQRLEQDLKQIAQQIINIGEQTQRHKEITITATARDSSQQIVIGEVSGTANFGRESP